VLVITGIMLLLLAKAVK